MRQPKSERTRSGGAGLFAELGLEFAFEGWMLFSSCYGLDASVWYPSKGGDTAKARKICDRCYVKNECLQYALEHHEVHGIWGGKSYRQRLKILKDNGFEAPQGHSTRTRYRCGGCVLVTQPSSLGMHQKFTGHSGRTLVEDDDA